MPLPPYTPTYLRVADELRYQIRIGSYRPGNPVPSSRALEATHRIANATARSALRILRDEGWIHSSPAKGYVVAATAPSEAPCSGDEGRPQALRSAEYRELSERIDLLAARLGDALTFVDALRCACADFTARRSAAPG